VSRSDARRRLLTLALEDAEDIAEAEAILRANEPRVSWEERYRVRTDDLRLLFSVEHRAALAHEQTQQPWPSDHREPLRCLASRQAATKCTPPRKCQRRHLC
jgi:hypothetical protein